MQAFNNNIVVVDGNLSVGKTSILKELEKKFPEKVKIHFEPVETYQWLAGINCLSEFYIGNKEQNFKFQMRVLLSNIENLKLAIRAVDFDDGRIQIIERGVLSSIHVFAETLFQTGKCIKIF